MHVAARTQIQVLAVVNHREIERLGQLHGAAHHARIHYRAAVIRDSHDACVLHGADGGELFAGAVLGDRPDGEDVHHGVLAGALDDVAGDGGIIVHRQRVGHAADGGEAAGRRGAGAGLDGFGMLDARLAQMHVHVDQPGRHHQSGGIEYLGTFRVKILADCLDAAVVDAHIGRTFVAGRGVDDVAVLNDESRHVVILG